MEIIQSVCLLYGREKRNKERRGNSTNVSERRSRIGTANEIKLPVLTLND